MKRCDHPMLSSAAAIRRAPPRHRPLGSARTVAAEMLLMSLLAIPLSARAEDLPSPGVVDGTTPVQSIVSDHGQDAGSIAQPFISAEDITRLLPLIVTLPEHKKIAADLERSLRQNNFDLAERQLREAMEAGALASILIDWLRHPDFPRALQALELPGAADSGTSPSSRQVNLQETEDDAAAAQLTEFKRSLDRERERADLSSQNLASVTEELNALKAVHAKVVSDADNVAALQAALEQQRMRAEAAVQALASTTERFHAFQEERSEDVSSSAGLVASLKEEAQQERRRADAAMHQLADVLEEFRVVRGIRETGPTPLILRLERIGVRTPVQRESENRPAPSQPVVETGTIPSAVPVERIASVDPAEATPVLRGPEKGSTPTASAQARPAARGSETNVASKSVSAEDRLTMRGDALFRQGDISGARLLLERAREAGSARATFILAETFDPHVLSERGAIGIRSDAAKARDLYGRALAQGIDQASARLEALK